MNTIFRSRENYDNLFKSFESEEQEETSNEPAETETNNEETESEEVGVYASSQGMFDTNDNQTSIGGYVL
jgi:hypothetical protein